MCRSDFSFLGEDKGNIDQRVGDEYQKNGQHQLASALQLAETEYGNNTSCYLHKCKHVTVRSIVRNQQCGAEQQIQGGTAPNENIDNYDEEKNRYSV